MSDRPEDRGARAGAPSRHPWLGAAWGCVLAAVVTLLIGAAGTRAGLWGYRVGSLLVNASVWFGLAAILLGGLAMARSRRIVGGVVVVIAAAAVIALPVRVWLASRGAPAIADVTTDPDNPPRFVAVARLRAGSNPVAHGGPLVAAAQRAAYPDLRPLILMVAPRQALAMAADTARAEGWTIVGQDLGFGDLGRLEATDTSTWFGRTDDIVVRVLPHAAGSRVDVRSSARDDVRDGGRNARRVRRFLAYLAERAQADPGSPR